MTAHAPVMVEPVTVREFLGILHVAAAAALDGANRPGLMQLTCIHPKGGKPLTFRFPIGDVDRMAAEAVRQAQAGLNVYVEARTILETAPGRGSAADTRGVFAFVVDDDADKGKGGRVFL